MAGRLRMTNKRKCDVAQRTTFIAGLVAVISGSACLLAKDTNPKPRNCFYAINENGKVVLPCTRSDSLKIGQNRVIGVAASALGIDISDVSFRGCPGAAYSASEDILVSSPRYVITYPLENGITEVGPFIHELAHVYQFQAAGGMKELTRTSSRKIELAADFMAGLVFKNALIDVNPQDYETGISLMGLYFESGTDQHGKPEERTAAFLTGYNFKFNKDVPNIATASLYFYEDIYGDL